MADNRGICQHAAAVVLALLLTSQVYAATLTGTVTGFESRKPVSEAQVELSTDGLILAQAVTDTSGEFVATVPAGLIEIRVIHEGL